MLEQVEAGNLVQDLKMDILQAILYIIKGWGEVSAKTIRNCWHHTKILPSNVNLSDDLREAGDLRLEGLIRSLDTLCLPNAMEVDEFLILMVRRLFTKSPRKIKLLKSWHMYLEIMKVLKLWMKKIWR